MDRTDRPIAGEGNGSGQRDAAVSYARISHGARGNIYCREAKEESLRIRDARMESAERESACGGGSVGRGSDSLSGGVHEPRVLSR